jgi:dihydroorotate dehydrogenase electron transfer subunit
MAMVTNTGADACTNVRADATERPSPFVEKVVALENEEIAPAIFCLALTAPRVAGCLEPGQFIHLLLPGLESHLLRRPFSIYAFDAERGRIEIVYQAVGEGTRFLAGVEPGVALDLIGPLGQGWRVPAGTRSALLVAGGVGIAPLTMLVPQLLKTARVCLVMGAQSGKRLIPLSLPPSLLLSPPALPPAPVPPLPPSPLSAVTAEEASRLTIITTTDDGSAGRKGFTTDVARELLQQDEFDYLACCGPEPMQRIAAALAAAAGVPCEVSLERRMACGIGACLSCVVLTRAGMRRACVDGPVFDAEEVIW